MRRLLGVDRRKEAHRAAACTAAAIAALALSLAASPGASALEASAPGELLSFGADDFGQLGRAGDGSSLLANPIPAQAPLPSGAGAAVQLAAGGAASLALTAGGRLYSFGSNRWGQLGRVAGAGSEAANPTPTAVGLPGGEGATQVAAGGEHSLVLTSAGRLYTFGLNLHGELGRGEGSGAEAANPTPAPVSLPGAGGAVVQIAAGGAHSLALTSTGQLYAFGQNSQGQLGGATNIGSEAANPTPTRVALPESAGPVVQIAAGAEHSLALTATGQLYAFGSNRYGQLGRLENVGSSIPAPTPMPVSLPGASAPIVQIAAGGFHSLALTAGGALYAFGRDDDGQLGTPGATVTVNPTPTRASLPDASPVVQLAAGELDSLALTAGGRLYAFGSNALGELGNPAAGETNEPTAVPTVAALPAATTIDAVARGASARHTLALVADLAVLSNSLPAGQPGVAYDASAQAGGGSGGYSWSAGGLPAGLSIDPRSGQIGGTPTGPSVGDVLLHVSDAFGIEATSAPIPLTVAAAPLLRAFVASRLTEAEIRASLGAQLGMKGRGAHIATVRRRRSFAYAFTALTAGTLEIDWYYVPPGAHLSQNARPVLFAGARTSFPTAGTRRLTLKLTPSGRKLLRHRKQIELTARGSFTPSGKRTITVSRVFRLAR